MQTEQHKVSLLLVEDTMGVMHHCCVHYHVPLLEVALVFAFHNLK